MEILCRDLVKRAEVLLGDYLSKDVLEVKLPNKLPTIWTELDRWKSREVCVCVSVSVSVCACVCVSLSLCACVCARLCVHILLHRAWCLVSFVQTTCGLACTHVLRT